MNYALLHKATFFTGEAGYSRSLPRGHAEVRHDSYRYIYDLRGIRDPRDFRAWVRRAWNSGHHDRRLVVSGSYPSYRVRLSGHPWPTTWTGVIARLTPPIDTTRE